MRNKAAIPDIIGAAIDVPSQDIYCCLPGKVLQILSPGALTSYSNLEFFAQSKLVNLVCQRGRVLPGLYPHDFKALASTPNTQLYAAG